MTTIQLPVNFSDTGLDNGIDLKTMLANHPNLVAWWQADGEHVDLTGGAIATWRNVKTGGKIATSQVNPPPLSVLAGYNGFTAADFSPQTNSFGAITAGLDFTGVYSVVSVGRRGLSGTVETAFAFATSFNNSISLQSASTGANYQYFHAGLGINIPAGGNSPDAAPKVAMASFDGTTLFGSVGRGATVTGTPGANPINANDIARIGKNASGGTDNSWRGSLSDIMLWNTAVHTPANADLKEYILQMFGGVYGLTF